MNTKHLRQTLKAQWLTYYRENREWLTRLGVWVTCEGKRRPSSSFILATLSTLEPELVQLLPLIVDLTSNPDRIVIALGLNFNPDDELETLAQDSTSNGQIKMLPGGASVVDVSAKQTPAEQAQPTIVQAATQKSTEPLSPKISPESQQQPSATTVIESPFGEPVGPLVEPVEEETRSGEETPEAPTVSTAAPQPKDQTTPRPVINSAELAAGELSDRNTTQLDDSCEGVRSRSSVRTRWD